jgi:ammonia channel protein AmtB
VKATPGAAETFRNHALVAAGVAVVGMALAAVLPQAPEDRWSALWGTGLAALTGAVSLGLKRYAMRRNIQAALKVVGLVFGLRAVTVAAGVYVMVTRGPGPWGFVVGFFGVYFVLQWVEISYVSAASRSAAGGDK